MKKVKVVVELDSSFVRLLQAAVQMKGWLHEESKEPLDPIGVLAVAVLAEARGANALQSAMIVPPAWRPHIDILHDERRVTEIPD